MKGREELPLVACGDIPPQEGGEKADRGGIGAALQDADGERGGNGGGGSPDGTGAGKTCMGRNGSGRCACSKTGFQTMGSGFWGARNMVPLNGSVF